MKKTPLFIIALIFIYSCGEGEEKIVTSSPVEAEYREISTDEFDLLKPNSEVDAVLILFGGFAETPSDIKREFQILEPAGKNSVALAFSKSNKRLWLENRQKKQMAQALQNLFDNHDLSADNVYLGGFSSGGNIALILGDYLTENPDFGIVPKGIFIVDSPVDLAGLYATSEKNIERDFSETSIRESKWLIAMLGDRFGDPKNQLHVYEDYSVFTLATRNIENIKHLDRTKIRLYTEPDTAWWKANRANQYSEINARYIKELSKTLESNGFTQVSYNPTRDRGHRANGNRHPHSWSIVQTDRLVEWMLD